MKKGLVLEGGAMRGLWTAGVIDVMMEHGVQPDGLIGVSAGAAFGCNYKSHQIGRAIRYNTRFAKDPRYSGWKSLLTSGDYYNANFLTTPGKHTLRLIMIDSEVVIEQIVVNPDNSRYSYFGNNFWK